MNDIDIFKQVEKAPFAKGYLPSGEAVLDRRHEKIVKAIPEGGNVLEIGPGNGKLGIYFLARHQPYCMIDISRKDLFGFYKYIGTQLAVPCFVFEKPWEWEILDDKAFKYCIAAEVIEHVDDYKWMINEMIRLTSKKIVITTPVGQSFFCEDHKHFFTEKDFEFIEQPYTIEEITTKEQDEQTGQRCYFIEIEAA